LLASTETVSVGLAVVVPVAGDTLSQGVCEGFATAAAYVSAVLVLLPTVTVCAAGELPPTMVAKLSEFVLTVIAPEVTVRVTGTVTELPPVVAVKVILPL